MSVTPTGRLPVRNRSLTVAALLAAMRRNRAATVRERFLTGRGPFDLLSLALRRPAHQQKNASDLRKILYDPPSILSNDDDDGRQPNDYSSTLSMNFSHPHFA